MNWKWRRLRGYLIDKLENFQRTNNKEQIMSKKLHYYQIFWKQGFNTFDYYTDKQFAALTPLMEYYTLIE
jgi:hypothetical protein